MGILNTIGDFVIFNVLYGLAHFPLIVANMCAVTIMMSVSLQLNRRFVFGNKDGRRGAQAVKFAVVTLLGLYVIQNVILIAALGILEGMRALSGLLANNFVQVNIAKAIGVGASAVWDFVLYKLWVFRVAPDDLAVGSTQTTPED